MAIKISGSTIIDDSRGIVNAGISTFNNDVTFLGASYNATWDKSDNSLIFADNAKAKFGTGGDLEISHNGSNGTIASTDTIRVKTPYFQIQNSAGTENIALFYDDTDGVYLLNNNATKFCTTTYGACVVGALCATQFYGDGSNLSNLPGFEPTSGSQGTENLYAGTGAGAASDSDTCFNIALGLNAGNALNSGDNNVFLGKYAGKNATSGGDNISMGICSGFCNTSGFNNVFLGRYAGKCNTSSRNIYIGKTAGQNATTANDNIFLGTCAGGSGAVTGGDNIFLGRCAGIFMTSGERNINIGCNTGKFACGSNEDNIHIGTRAGENSTTTQNNVVIGSYILGCSSGFTGNYNVLLGYASGCTLSSGAQNVFLGMKSGHNTTTGTRNIALGGFETLGTNTTGGCNIALGGNALESANSHHNIALGQSAGANITSGCYNIALGASVCLPGATTSCQLAIGTNACRWIRGDNSFNVCLGNGTAIKAMADGKMCATCFVGSCFTGVAACINASNVDAASNADYPVIYVVNTNKPRYDDTSGEEFTYNPSSGTLNAKCFVGDGTGLTGVGFSADADKNLIAGCNAASSVYNPASCIACDNVILGTNAGCKLTSGCSNVLIGKGSGTCIQGASCNTFVGHYSGFCISSGVHNTFLGFEAGFCNSTGCHNVFIGKGTGCGNTTGCYNVAIGSEIRGGNAMTGCYNIMFGRQAGRCITTGIENIFMGRQVGNNTGTGYRNIAIGASCTLYCNLGGNDNIAIGQDALYCANKSYNIAIGALAGRRVCTSCCNIIMGAFAVSCDDVTGSDNIVFGSHAGKCLCGVAARNILMGKDAVSHNQFTGCDNIVMGQCAGKCLSDGLRNVILGMQAGCCVNSGFNNVFLGTYAGQESCGSVTTSVAIGFGAGMNRLGTHNVSIGNRAGNGSSTVSNNTGGCNVFIGSYAGCCISSGIDNVTIGTRAGAKLTTGPKNVFIGCYAGCSITNCGCNVFIGEQAGRCNSGPNNIYLGRYAGRGSSTVSNNTGGYNVAIGYEAGRGTTSGQYNSFFGKQAGYYNTTGQSNTFIGERAGEKNCSGTRNTFIGSQAGLCNQSGGCNVFIGPEAGRDNTTGCHNIVMGHLSGYTMTTGCYNIFLGKEIGRTSATTGDCNIALGVCAACALTSGCSNIFLGFSAGATNTSGCCNIAIGNQVCLPSNTGNNQLAIGDGSNRWIAGDSSYNVTIANKLQVNTSGIVTATSGIVTYYGDGSQLQNVGLSLSDDTSTNATRYLLFDEATSGSISSINVSSSKLTFNPSTGNLVVGGTVTANSDEKLKTNIRDIPDPLDKLLRLRGVEFDRTDIQDRQIGVIAQEVEQVIPEVVYGSDLKSVAYANMVALLIEAVKEQNLKIEEQNQRIVDLESRIGG